MRTRTNPRLRLLALVVVILAFAASCAQSSDPTSWEEAIEDGSVEDNFLTSCAAADDGATADAISLADYCRCSFDELQETFADDFGRFQSVDDALRNDPAVITNQSSIDDSELRADIAAAATVINGCVTEHLG